MIEVIKGCLLTGDAYTREKPPKMSSSGSSSGSSSFTSVTQSTVSRSDSLLVGLAEAKTSTREVPSSSSSSSASPTATPSVGGSSLQSSQSSRKTADSPVPESDRDSDVKKNLLEMISKSEESGKRNRSLPRLHAVLKSPIEDTEAPKTISTSTAESPRPEYSQVLVAGNMTNFMHGDSITKVSESLKSRAGDSLPVESGYSHDMSPARHLAGETASTETSLPLSPMESLLPKPLSPLVLTEVQPKALTLSPVEGQVTSAEQSLPLSPVKSWKFELLSPEASTEAQPQTLPLSPMRGQMTSAKRSLPLESSKPELKSPVASTDIQPPPSSEEASANFHKRSLPLFPTKSSQQALSHMSPVTVTLTETLPPVSPVQRPPSFPENSSQDVLSPSTSGTSLEERKMGSPEFPLSPKERTIDPLESPFELSNPEPILASLRVTLEDQKEGSSSSMVEERNLKPLSLELDDPEPQREPLSSSEDSMTRSGDSRTSQVSLPTSLGGMSGVPIPADLEEVVATSLPDLDAQYQDLPDQR